jgi:hypothetical protein
MAISIQGDGAGMSGDHPEEFLSKDSDYICKITGPYSKAVRYDDCQCRMFYEVVLRPDQIDLIAKRVVDLLKEDT